MLRGCFYVEKYLWFLVCRNGAEIMQWLLKIDKATYEKYFTGYPELDALNTKEDVATFIDTFEASSLSAWYIWKVLDISGHYVFVFDENATGYDFFTELNNLSQLGITLSSANVKLLCPKELSRGYCEAIKFKEGTSEDDEPQTSGVSSGDDIPTGFLDEDELSSLMSNDRKLLHVRGNVKLPVNDSYGFTIGRSTSMSDYVVQNGKVSRKHAQVYLKGGKVFVHDCSSANGTYIDGLRVREDHDRELPVGSTLMLADEKFKLL